MDQPQATKYHDKDGWVFVREPNGDVRITVYTSFDAQTQEVKESTLVPADQWPSIVSAMAKNHGTAEEHGVAKQLHIGGIPDGTDHD